MGRSFLKRVSGQIDLRNLRLVAGVDRLSERSLIAPEFIVGWHQANPGATRANYPRRILQTRIEGLRIRRLTAGAAHGRCTRPAVLAAFGGESADFLAALAGRCIRNGGIGCPRARRYRAALGDTTWRTADSSPGAAPGYRSILCVPVGVRAGHPCSGH